MIRENRPQREGQTRGDGCRLKTIELLSQMVYQLFNVGYEVILIGLCLWL